MIGIFLKQPAMTYIVNTEKGYYTHFSDGTLFVKNPERNHDVAAEFPYSNVAFIDYEYIPYNPKKENAETVSGNEKPA